MANGYNMTVQVGNLTRDPELRYTANGTAVCNMGIAVNTKYGDKEETLYIDVVIWGRQGEAVSQYLSKGRQVLVEGRLQTRSWEKDGEKKYKTEIVANAVRFLGSKGDTDNSAPDEISDIEPF